MAQSNEQGGNELRPYDINDLVTFKEQLDSMDLRKHNELDEAFTKVLMQEHSHDWDMETVREAALICSNLAIADRKQHELEARIDELSHIRQPARTSKQKYLGLDYLVGDRLAELKSERERLGK